MFWFCFRSLLNQVSNHKAIIFQLHLQFQKQFKKPWNILPHCHPQKIHTQLEHNNPAFVDKFVLWFMSNLTSTICYCIFNNIEGKKTTWYSHIIEWLSINATIKKMCTPPFSSIISQLWFSALTHRNFHRKIFKFWYNKPLFVDFFLPNLFKLTLQLVKKLNGWLILLSLFQNIIESCYWLNIFSIFNAIFYIFFYRYPNKFVFICK